PEPYAPTLRRPRWQRSRGGSRRIIETCPHPENWTLVPCAAEPPVCGKAKRRHAADRPPDPNINDETRNDPASRPRARRYARVLPANEPPSFPSPGHDGP